MHTCSRPCKRHIVADMEDVHSAIAFIEGRDRELERESIQKMNDLAAETRFEEAEIVHGQTIKSRRAQAGVQGHILFDLEVQL